MENKIKTVADFKKLLSDLNVEDDFKIKIRIDEDVLKKEIINKKSTDSEPWIFFLSGSYFLDYVDVGYSEKIIIFHITND